MDYINMNATMSTRTHLSKVVGACNGKSRYIYEAAAEAVKSQMANRIGCVAVMRGVIIARGYNIDGFTRVGSRRVRAHAECSVLSRVLHSHAYAKVS
jgi:hypothetical protein